MTVTLSNIIFRARSRLNEPAYPTYPNSTVSNPPARFFSDTEITEWVNDGLRDIARRAEDLITYDNTIAIPAYSENPSQPIPTYSLDLGTLSPSGSTSDVLRIARVEFQVAYDSSQVYPMEWAPQSYLDQIWNTDQLSSTSYPTFWTTRGFPGGTGRSAFVIQIYPQASQAGQLNIFYYRLPQRITDPVATPSNYTTLIDLIEGWDDMLVDFVHYQGLIKRRDSSWKDIQALYESKMQNVIETSRQFSNQVQYLSYDSLAMPWSNTWGGW